MANTWFKFKQFTIGQGQTAMKVGTDGVLLGAWTDVVNKSKILDIGTGTGLIALMLAQRNQDAIIDAVELDTAGSIQAKENLSNSDWSNRLFVINQSIQEFSQETTKTYDLIVSNPPYFENSFSANTTQRQMARATDSLSFEELISCSKKLLKQEGSFALIIPSDNSKSFINQCKDESLFLKRRCHIYPKLDSEIKRVLLEFSFTESNIQESKLVIEPHRRHEYSEAYIELTKDFYLKF